MANIYFDFDGTIVNSQTRLYNLFCEICAENTLSYQQYWEIKRNHITQSELLFKYFAYTDDKISLFHNIWQQKVEEPERILRDDFPVEGIADVLRNLAKNHKLFIITNRQSIKLTNDEIKSFGWQDIFNDVFVTQQKCTKLELMQGKINTLQKNVFVGDTGEDIKTAKAFNAISIGVTYGVMNHDVLNKYLPDFIVNTPKDLEQILTKRI